MKMTNQILFVVLLISGTSLFGQTKLVEKKIGHIYYLSIPDYMSKTRNLNNDASLQYENKVKEAYTIVIEDSKEELEELGMIYQNAEEFYDDFIKTYSKAVEDAKTKEPKNFTIDGNAFTQGELTYVSDSVNIYMLATVVETKTNFYKILSWTTKENKDKLKDDFIAIAKTLRD